MKVISKAQANKLIVKSLFTQGGTLTINELPFSACRYNKSIIGSEVVNIEGIKHVFAAYTCSGYKLRSISYSNKRRTT